VPVFPFSIKRLRRSAVGRLPYHVEWRGKMCSWHKCFALRCGFAQQGKRWLPFLQYGWSTRQEPRVELVAGLQPRMHQRAGAGCWGHPKSEATPRGGLRRLPDSRARPGQAGELEARRPPVLPPESRTGSGGDRVRLRFGINEQAQ